MRKLLPVLTLLLIAVPCRAQVNVVQFNLRIGNNPLAINAQIPGNVDLNFPGNTTGVGFTFTNRTGGVVTLTFSYFMANADDQEPGVNSETQNNMICQLNPSGNGTQVQVVGTSPGQIVLAGASIYAWCPIPVTGKASFSVTSTSTLGYDVIATVFGVPQASVPQMVGGANGIPFQETGTGVLITSGTATLAGQSAADTPLIGNPVTVSGVDAAGLVQELPVADAGSAPPLQVLLVGGTTGAVINPLLLDSGSSLFVDANGSPSPPDTPFIGNPVVVGGVDGSGNTQELPVADVGTVTPAQVLLVGGQDGFGNIRPFQTQGNQLDGNGAVGFLTNAPHLFNGVTWDREFKCALTKFVTGVAATTTQIVAGVAGQKIRVCTVVIERNDITGVATTLKLVEGTGANCAAGQTPLTGNLFTSGATAVTADSPPAVINNHADGAFVTNVAADALCVQTTGAASSFDVTITEAQY